MIHIIVKLPPLTIQKFNQLIIRDYYYIDKSLLIKCVIEHSEKYISFSQPRYSGKTINLTMLNDFFNKDNAYKRTTLFSSLYIHNTAYNSFQGKYPTIFLSFHILDANCYSNFMILLSKMMGDLYNEYRYLSYSNQLTLYDKNVYHKIANQKASDQMLLNALYHLVYFLYKHHCTPVVVLLDDVDYPFLSCHPYNEKDNNRLCYDFLIVFIRLLLNAHSYIFKVIMMSVQPINLSFQYKAMTSCVSYSLLNNPCLQYFSISNQEIAVLLKNYDAVIDYNQFEIFQLAILKNDADYLNYYHLGSIINYLNNKKTTIPDMQDQKNIQLMQYLIRDARTPCLKKLFSVMHGHCICQYLDDQHLFSTLNRHEVALWSFFVFCGHLTAHKLSENHSSQSYRICLTPMTNTQVNIKLFDALWDVMHQSNFELVVDAMQQDNLQSLKQMLEENIRHVIINNEFIERFYRCLLLGFVSYIRHIYVIIADVPAPMYCYSLLLLAKNQSKNITNYYIYLSQLQFENDAIGQAAVQHCAELVIQKYSLKNCHTIGLIFKQDALRVIFHR